MKTGTTNQTLETNCRSASPLVAWWQFGRAVHAHPCVSGGSRSAAFGLSRQCTFRDFDERRRKA